MFLIEGAAAGKAGRTPSLGGWRDVVTERGWRGWRPGTVCLDPNETGRHGATLSRVSNLGLKYHPGHREKNLEWMKIAKAHVGCLQEARHRPHN